MLVCNDREKLVWLVQIANIYNSSYRFCTFSWTHSSFIIQLHPTTPSNFSFTIFFFSSIFFFSLQRCIICAKLFYRLKKPTACIEYGIIRFYWIQGIAFMFIFVGIYIFFQKKSSPIHPEKANYKIVLWKDIRKVFHHTQVSQICNNLKSFLFEHYGNHVM